MRQDLDKARQWDEPEGAPVPLDEVIQFIDSVARRRPSISPDAASDDLKLSILALRGRGKGEHLVERLLQSRREDQSYDE